MSGSDACVYSSINRCTRASTGPPRHRTLVGQSEMTSLSERLAASRESTTAKSAPLLLLLLLLVHRPPALPAAMSGCTSQFSSPSPVGSDDGFELVMLPLQPDGSGPRCLDGSAAGYYRRRGRGAGASTVIIELAEAGV